MVFSKRFFILNPILTIQCVKCVANQVAVCYNAIEKIHNYLCFFGCSARYFLTKNIACGNLSKADFRWGGRDFVSSEKNCGILFDHALVNYRQNS